MSECWSAVVVVVVVVVTGGHSDGDTLGLQWHEDIEIVDAKLRVVFPPQSYVFMTCRHNILKHDVLECPLVGLSDAILSRRRGTGSWAEVLTLAPCSSEMWAGRMVGKGRAPA